MLGENSQPLSYKGQDLSGVNFDHKNFTEEQIHEAKNWQRVRRDIN